MKYIEEEFVFPENKMIKDRSREKRDAHIEIHCRKANREDGKRIRKELKKAIHKMNRLLDNKVSYELTITLE